MMDNKNYKWFVPFVLCSTMALAQSNMRIHSGLGLGNDVSSYYALDYGNYLLNKESKFNTGARLGMFYYNFDNNKLTNDSKLYGSLAFSLKYQITNKFTFQVDSGTKIPLGKSKVAFLDEMNNEIPDSDIERHTYSMPVLTYNLNRDTGVFLGYHFVFKDQLDMNTLSLGLRLSLSGD
jgi:hypothetical protein